MIIFRAVMLGVILATGIAVFLKARTGEVRISNFSGQPTILSRQAQPVRFWAFLALNCAILAGATYLAIFGR